MQLGEQINVCVVGNEVHGSANSRRAAELEVA